jgi:hypothetical protein
MSGVLRTPVTAAKELLEKRGTVKSRERAVSQLVLRQNKNVTGSIGCRSLTRKLKNSLAQETEA